MTPTHEGLTEPDVTINGQTLTFAQSLTLRVAVTALQLQLRDPAFRRGIGGKLASNYALRLAEIEAAMKTRQVP